MRVTSGWRARNPLQHYDRCKTGNAFGIANNGVTHWGWQKKYFHDAACCGNRRHIPGVPDWAMCRAWVSVGFMSRRCRMVAQNLHNGRNKHIWSISCKAPRPLSSVAAAPPISKTGDSAICAFFMAVTVLVRPVHQQTFTITYIEHLRLLT